MTQPNPSAEIGIAIPSALAPSTLADTVGPNMAQPSQLIGQTFETFWETLGVEHMLARYKNLSTRLREDLNADTTHVDAIYDMEALERESLITY